MYRYARHPTRSKIGERFVARLRSMRDVRNGDERRKSGRCGENSRSLSVHPSAGRPFDRTQCEHTSGIGSACDPDEHVELRVRRDVFDGAREWRACIAIFPVRTHNDKARVFVAGRVDDGWTRLAVPYGARLDLKAGFAAYLLWLR